MRIAIVDDDTGFIKKVETVIEDYCQKAGEAATVRLFSDGGILLEGPGQERGYDAYILDVEMPRLDGLELDGQGRGPVLVALSPTPVSDGGGYQALVGAGL